MKERMSVPASAMMPRRPKVSRAHLWICLLTAIVHKALGPVTHCAVDTADSDWSASLGGHTSATGAGFTRCHRRALPHFLPVTSIGTKQAFSVALVGKYQRWLFSVKKSVSRWPSVACLLFNFDLVFLKEWSVRTSFPHLVGRDPEVGLLSLLSLDCGLVGSVPSLKESEVLKYGF